MSGGFGKLSGASVSSGGGGGLSGTFADEELLRGDSTTGVQGSSVTLHDTNGQFTQKTLNADINFDRDGTGVTYFSNDNAAQLQIDASGDVIHAGVDGFQVQGVTGADGTNPAFIPKKSDIDTGFGHGTADNTATITAGGIRAAQFNTVASGINALEVTPGASGNPVLIASTQVAGTGGISLIATAPAAAAGASVAGKPVAITASPAVASTDTAGAAAGGNITITAGAAARNASGNANGGNITLTPGAPIGTGTDGVVWVGTGSAFGLQYTGSKGYVYENGVPVIEWDGAHTSLRADGLLRWAINGALPNTYGTGLSTPANGVLAIGKGTAAADGYFQWGGQSFLAADATNATTTMANTGLSVTVTTGRKYGFKCILFLDNSLDADGMKIDFDGGTATATNFRAHVTVFDNALNLSTQVTALATDVAATTIVGNTLVEVEGSFEPSSIGTFIPRFAGNTAVSGTLTLARGSNLTLFDYA